MLPQPVVMRNGMLTNRFNLRKRNTNRDPTEDDFWILGQKTHIHTQITTTSCFWKNSLACMITENETIIYLLLY